MVVNTVQLEAPLLGGVTSCIKTQARVPTSAFNNEFYVCRTYQWPGMGGWDH